MKIIAVIPARYDSQRFPGKPLALINGKPMIQWVYEQTKKVELIKDVYVATDDKRIFDSVVSFGGLAIMTGECSCGTDRIYEAGKDIDADIVLNVQGDEPMINPQMIEEVLSAFEDESVLMATLKKRIDNSEDLNNPNVVKVITDYNNDAIYFSRYPIPYMRNEFEEYIVYKHIGMYAYKKDFMKTFVELPKSFLEKSESLEQLRCLENGFKIRVIETNGETIGVDTPEQLKAVEEAMIKEGWA